MDATADRPIVTLLFGAILRVVDSCPGLACIAGDFYGLTDSATAHRQKRGAVKVGSAVLVGDLALEADALSNVGIEQSLLLGPAGIFDPDLFPRSRCAHDVEQALALGVVGRFGPVLEDGAALQRFLDTVCAVSFSGLEVEDIPIA